MRLWTIGVVWSGRRRDGPPVWGSGADGPVFHSEPDAIDAAATLRPSVAGMARHVGARRQPIGVVVVVHTGRTMRPTAVLPLSSEGWSTSTIGPPERLGIDPNPVPAPIVPAGELAWPCTCDRCDVALDGTVRLIDTHLCDQCGATVPRCAEGKCHK